MAVSEVAEPDAGWCELEIDSMRPLESLTASLNVICDQVEDRPGDAIVVLRLMPTPESHFWSGAGGITAVSRWEHALRRVERLNAATIAVAEGNCGGPGLDALLTVDCRIVTRNFQLVLGRTGGQVWPGMVLYRLANQLGAARARQVVLLGKEISAERAGDIGLIDEIADDVAAALRAAASMLRRGSGTGHGIRRQLLIEAPTSSFEEAIGVHLAACDRELRRETRDNGSTVSGECDPLSNTMKGITG